MSEIAPIPDTHFIRLARAGLFISGEDAEKFLQGLITNDIDEFKNKSILYSCILSPQGKFLHDFLITQHEDGFLLDCGVNPVQEQILRRLTIYRLRAKIEITPIALHVIAGFGTVPDIAEPAQIFHDPRHPNMGWRGLSVHPIPAPLGYTELPFDVWDRRRIELCIPDGIQDTEPGVSTLEDLNIPRLNGVSFTKGCYVGQELTARMQNRGLGKRHLYTVHLNLPEPGSIPPEPSEIFLENQEVGKIRSKCDTVAIALIRDDAVAKAHEKGPDIHLTPIPNGWKITL